MTATGRGNPLDSFVLTRIVVTPMFRRFIFLSLLLAGCNSALHAAQADPAGSRETLDSIVAVVNNDVITRTELNDRLRTIRQQLQQQGAPVPPQAVLEKQVLDRMILSNLQLQLADRAGVRVDEETLNRTIARIAEENRMTLGEFRAVLEQDGYDFADFREDIRKEILISRIQQRQIAERVSVSEQEIDNFLTTQKMQGNAGEEYRLAHILIAVPDASSPERLRAARERAEDILKNLRNGADFQETAIAVSDGQQALEGGDLGWRKLAELPTLFVDAANAMDTGAVSDLIRSPSGYHIIKLLDKRSGQRHIVTQTHARHILIRPDELTSEEAAEQQLHDLRTRLEQGADFAELARGQSDDTVSAANGGDLGWANPGDMTPAFESAMDSLDEGQISQPFKTDFGWHLVQVLERRERDNTADLLRDQARDAIRQRKMDEELQAWLTRLRDEAHIESRLSGE